MNDFGHLPLKILWGYKFNIFYLALIDKLSILK